MEKNKLVAIIFLTMIFLSGCTSDILDTKSLLEAPRLSNKYVEIQKTLDDLLSDYSLVTPQKGVNK